MTEADNNKPVNDEWKSKTRQPWANIQMDYSFFSHESQKIKIIITMIYFWSAFPRETCSTALNKCRDKNRKHMHIRHSKQHVSKQSGSNIELSSTNELKQIYVPIKRRNRINVLIHNPDHTNKL